MTNSRDVDGQLSESAVLGAVLVDNDLWPTVAEALRPEDFSDVRKRIVFSALSELSASGSPLDVLILKNKLYASGTLETVGGAVALAALMDGIPKAANVAYYAAIVKDRSIRRELTKKARDIIADAANSSDSTDEIMDRAEQGIFELSKLKRLSRGFEQVRIAALEAVDRFDAAYNKKSNTGIKFGLKDLDSMLCGMQNGDFIIIASRPSVGKTALGLHVARVAAINGAVVGLLSMEMARAALAVRLFSADGDIDTWKILNGFASEYDWHKVEETAGRLAAMPIWIDDSPAVTLLELRAKARRMKSDNKMQLLIVDYLQLMTGTKSDNRQQEIADLSRGLKAIARDLDIPVVALSQLRRIEDRPRLSDLRESGAIEQDADTVLGLWRDGDGDKNNGGAVEVIVLKQRQGPTGTVKVYFDPSRQRFADLEKE